MYDTKKLGKVDIPLLRKRQDYALWLKILKNIDYAYCLPEVLSTYRVRSESVSSNKIRLLKYNYELFRIHEGFGVLTSLYYLGWNILIKVLKR